MLKTSRMIIARISCVCLSVSAIATPRPFALPRCLQDQAGNQYQNLTLDHAHHIVSGHVSIKQSECENIPYSMVGSWVMRNGHIVLQLSVANNSNDTKQCVPIYMLKGPYPLANWYYSDGIYEDQRFTYSECSADSPLPYTNVGGVHGIERSR